jgi:hypothetical protein
MYPIKQNGIQEKFLKIGIMVALVAIATIGIGMANANRVLADDSGGIQNHFGDNHEGDEHSETCISLSCCHHCGSEDRDLGISFWYHQN